MSIDPSTTLAKNENVAFRRLAEGEGGVLLHLESGEYHGINEVGCLIWELVDGERTVDGLVVALGEDGAELVGEAAEDGHLVLSQPDPHAVLAEPLE
jgi:hypothetical protein